MGTKLCRSDITAIKKLKREPTKMNKANETQNKNRRIFEKSYWYTNYINKEENEN